MQKTNGGAGAIARAGFIEGHQLDSVYVDDQRSVPGDLTAVRLVNGAAMPTTNGLTVATQLPLYVLGNYNLNNGDPNAGTNTSLTQPASLVGDAVTILSSAWNDGTSSSTTASGRLAVNTTVNAAIIAGIVSTTAVGNNKYYSGGVENFPRFLEDWDNKALTYNGSMVVMFNSRYATNFWQSPSGSAYYTPPARKWAFDVNFLNQTKLRPSTPQLRVLVRGQWTIAPPPGS
jgi:hypothetical protein